MSVTLVSPLGPRLTWGPGVHALVLPAALALQVVEAARGAHLSRPLVWVDGLLPRRSPALRRQVAVASAAPTLPAGAGALRDVLRALHPARPTDAWLERARLAHRADQDPLALTAPEREQLSLVMALEAEAPRLVVLDAPGPAADRLGISLDAALSAMARGGAVVVLLVRAEMDALRLGATLASGSPLPPPSGSLWTARVFDESAPRIARALLEQTPALELRVAPGVLSVAGPDPRQLSRELLRAALAAGVAPSSLRIEPGGTWS